MPELPEIETLKNCLESKILGLSLIKLQQNRENLRYKLFLNFEQELLNSSIVSCRRRAKFLIIELNNANSLVIHLGMSGRLTLQPSNYPEKKHDHVIFLLSNGEKLVFNDARRFGMIYSMKTELLEKELFNKFGIEPLDKHFNSEYLKNKISRKIPIKTLLTNNRILVGVGNIYASESLFLAGIHPAKLGGNLSASELEKLVESIQMVLRKAISLGGTTLKDFVSSDSSPGYFAQELSVYGRKNLPCIKCSSTILQIKQAGRSSFFCPTCQVDP